MKRILTCSAVSVIVACSAFDTESLNTTGPVQGFAVVRGSYSGDGRYAHLFFDEDELLTASAFDCSDTAFFNLRVGYGTVFSFKNLPSDALSAVSSIADLRSVAVNLSDNVRSGAVSPQMFGSHTAEIGVDGPSFMVVPLKRYLFRVTLRSITNELVYPWENADVHYLGTFLENIPSSIHLDGSPCGGCALVSEGGCCDSGFILSGNSDADDYQEPLMTVCDRRSSPVPIPPFEFVRFQPEWMYSFPDEISANLRIVVALEIESDIYYYPVSLSGLQSNESVNLDLTIRKPGSDDPDKPVLGAQAVSLSVDIFEDGPVLDIKF